MAIYTFKKYKISLQHDSKKTQGLRTGDIVRRQYFNGTNLIYSLMCVLSYGKEEVVDANTNEIVERNYFIGALLEGDIPQSEQILDFARITNLFDTSRSGALYLTGSDDQAPYMDVIDGIGRNASLSWPENIASNDYADAESQYIVSGAVVSDYLPFLDDNRRVLHIKRTTIEDEGFVGIHQDFYKYVQNPDRVLVSYKIKSSRSLSCKISLGYQDGTYIDGEESFNTTTDWQYKLHAITIDYSGRYLRTLKLDLSAMKANDETWVADFNIILLSNLTNFNDASKIRIGKLTGVSDPVFGDLDGYGGYIQKLFASKSAHISGTLTAGDENGFGATFYAGKIHRNAFVNSLDINFVTPVTVDNILVNPTGIGKVYKFNTDIELNAQNNAWLLRNIGVQYTLSFWIYAESVGQINLLQNNKAIGMFQIAEGDTLGWHRHKVTFTLQPPRRKKNMIIALEPSFVTNGAFIYLTAPQLELGDIATQYQPTDDILNETNDYGAWLARGGIGGTIQNPLLRLNHDGSGAIDSRTNSFRLNQDGSGYLANNNIQWDCQGRVRFGEGVTLNWGNLGSDAQEEMANRYIRILGQDTFTVIGHENSDIEQTCSPASIILSLEKVGFDSMHVSYQWYLQLGTDWGAIPGETNQTLEVLPDSCYWIGYVSPPPTTDINGNHITYLGESRISLKCVATLDSGRNYIDTFNINKQYVDGYTVEVSSSQGTMIRNGSCATVLTATVYYQGQLVDEEFVKAHFVFSWHRYKAEDLNTEIGFDDIEHSINENVLTLNYMMNGSDVYVCKISVLDNFDYTFPIIF